MTVSTFSAGCHSEETVCEARHLRLNYKHAAGVKLMSSYNYDYIKQIGEDLISSQPLQQITYVQCLEVLPN